MRAAWRDRRERHEVNGVCANGVSAGSEDERSESSGDWKGIVNSASVGLAGRERTERPDGVQHERSKCWAQQTGSETSGLREI